MISFASSALPDVEAAPEAEAPAPEQDALSALYARFQAILGDAVTEVRASARLTGSPCCLVNPDGQTSSSISGVQARAASSQSLSPHLSPKTTESGCLRYSFPLRVESL